MPNRPLFYFIKQADNKYVYIACGIFGDTKRPSFLRPIADFHNLRRFYRFLTELQLHILLISFKITVYSYIVAGIKSGTKIGINPNKISRFIFTKKDGKTMKKKKEKGNNKGLSRYLVSVLLFLLFEAVAITLWLIKDNLFYLLNFSYIGTCLALGTALFTAEKRYARHFVQLAVGSYMLLYLGIISRENMQIEGFWYYLFLGVFEAATIHYAVAKIFGPLLFGRGWCGYACWTAMVLDFLPYKQPRKPRKEKLGILRYVMFALSLALVAGLFLFKVANLEKNMFWLFLAGNALYYISGIALAFIFKDNRAFCKYLCPITVFLKPMSYFSLLRVHCDESKCVHCGKCLKVCPMDVEVNKDSRKRKNGTECILCYECTKNCPTKALH